MIQRIVLAMWCGFVFCSALPAQTPQVVDCLKYPGKPGGQFGLEDTGFLYEHEATIVADSDTPTGAKQYTVEFEHLRTAAARFRSCKYAILDIESLPWYHHGLARVYLDTCRDATGAQTKWAWWNVAPQDTPDWNRNDTYYTGWIGRWRGMREPWVQACQFGAIACYVSPADTIETWTARQVPRIREARVLYGTKPIFVVLSPRRHLAPGKPFIDGAFVSAAMQAMADAGADRLVWWDVSANGFDPTWPWAESLRERVDSKGRYIPLFEPDIDTN